MTEAKREAALDAIRAGEPTVSICGRLHISSATLSALRKQLHGEHPEPQLFPE